MSKPNQSAATRQLSLAGLQLETQSQGEYFVDLRKKNKEMRYLIAFLEVLAASCPAYERELKHFAKVIKWKATRNERSDCALILAAIEAGYATRHEISTKTLIPPDTCHLRLKTLVKQGKVRKAFRTIPKRDEETGVGVIGGAWSENIYTIM